MEIDEPNCDGLTRSFPKRRPKFSDCPQQSPHPAPPRCLTNSATDRYILQNLGAIALLMTLAMPAVTWAAPTLTTLATFNGTDGNEPSSALVRDTSGNLYGTTMYGGSNNEGTVFELPAGGSTPQTLLNFTAPYSEPFTETSLLIDSKGNLFGTTPSGGSGGYAFEIAAGNRSISTLATFNYSTGSPQSALSADSAGNFYGTTSGGANNGIVYKIAASTNTFSTLASIPSAMGQSLSNVAFDSNGNLFGTTQTGGTGGYGTLFEIAAGTNTVSTIESFNKTNGAGPNPGLTFDGKGNLFGTTNAGGTYNDGTVFEILSGTNSLKTIASFSSIDVSNSGTAPYAGVLLDAKGNIFGTTAGGGPSGEGTIFEIAAGTNAITTLANFNGSNGGSPEGGLVADSSGNLFGTTLYPSAVFELTNSGFVVPEPSGFVLLAIASTTLLGRRFLHRASPYMRAQVLKGI